MGGIVLAGGGSTRMGCDKALLPWRGRPVIEHVVLSVRAAAQPVVVVAARDGQYALGPETSVTGDLYPGEGPLGGILTGLAKLAGEDSSSRTIHVVCACDMPGARADVLRLLLRVARGFDAAVPEVGGRLEPLCAAYSDRSEAPLRRQFESGERAMHVAVRALHLRIVTEAELRAVDPDLATFANLNTPQDYGRIRPTEPPR